MIDLTTFIPKKNEFDFLVQIDDQMIVMCNDRINRIVNCYKVATFQQIAQKVKFEYYQQQSANYFFEQDSLGAIGYDPNVEHEF